VAVSYLRLVRVRIRRSAVARQERERPSPLNRRNGSTAWCMIGPTYQTTAPYVKVASRKPL